jgi:hypothetical protein
MDVPAGSAIRDESSDLILGFGEVAEWLSSDVFSTTLNVSLNRAKDGKWTYRLGALSGMSRAM